eukprot:COSAG01_NODE_1284_length_10902_cov_45.724799_4_plen_67_part_00
MSLLSAAHTPVVLRASKVAALKPGGRLVGLRECLDSRDQGPAPIKTDTCVVLSVYGRPMGAAAMPL